MVSKKQMIYFAIFIFLTVSIIILLNYRKFKKKGKKRFTILDLVGLSSNQYSWNTGDWDKTCPPCGQATRKRSVTCSSGNPDDCYEIPQSEDEPFGKPVDTEICDGPECSDWTQPSFDPCPSCYSEPTKTLRSSTEVMCPEGKFCDPSKRPSDEFVCGVDDNKPLNRCSRNFADWITGPWSECPTCGPTNVPRTRTVTCSGADPENDCDNDAKPSSEEPCNNPVCTDWISPVFPECPKCNSAPKYNLEATTPTSCPQGMTCDPSQQPSNMRECTGLKPCGTWTTPVFPSRPTCGINSRVTFDATTPTECPEGYSCDADLRPSDSITYDNIRECEWTYGPWSGNPDVLSSSQ